MLPIKWQMAMTLGDLKDHLTCVKSFKFRTSRNTAHINYDSYT